MANLTSKELDALEDQLNFEHTCVCKYQAALRNSFNQYAGQHQQIFNTLLNFLR